MHIIHAVGILHCLATQKTRLELRSSFALGNIIIVGNFFFFFVASFFHPLLRSNFPSKKHYRKSLRCQKRISKAMPSETADAGSDSEAENAALLVFFAHHPRASSGSTVNCTHSSDSQPAVCCHLVLLINDNLMHCV